MDETPIREIKPVVVPGQFFIRGSLLSGFVSLFLGLLVGGIVWEFSAIEDVSSPSLPWTPYIRQWGLVYAWGISTSVFSFIVFMALLGIETYKAPSRTIYVIFSDRLECCEGVWTTNRRTLPLVQVIDVEMSEGLLQRTKGAGTVTLTLRHIVPEGEEKVSIRQVSLTNIPQPKEVYDLIRSLASRQTQT